MQPSEVQVAVVPQYNPIHGLMKGLGLISVLAFFAGVAMFGYGLMETRETNKRPYDESAGSKIPIGGDWRERVDKAYSRDLEDGGTKSLQKVEAEARFQAKVPEAARYAQERISELWNRWLVAFGAKLAGGAFLAMIAASILISSTRPPKQPQVHWPPPPQHFAPPLLDDFTVARLARQAAGLNHVPWIIVVLLILLVLGVIAWDAHSGSSRIDNPTAPSGATPTNTRQSPSVPSIPKSPSNVGSDWPWPWTLEDTKNSLKKGVKFSYRDVTCLNNEKKSELHSSLEILKTDDDGLTTRVVLTEGGEPFFDESSTHTWRERWLSSAPNESDWIVSDGDVTVPAGRFACWILKRDAKHANGLTYRSTKWFSKQYATVLVKAAMRDVNLTTDIELISLSTR